MGSSRATGQCVNCTARFALIRLEEGVSFYMFGQLLYRRVYYSMCEDILDQKPLYLALAMQERAFDEDLSSMDGQSKMIVLASTKNDYSTVNEIAWP